MPSVAVSQSPRRGRGCIARFVVLLVVLLVVYLVGLLLLPPVQTASRTLALVPELIGLPVRPLSLVTPEPQRITTSYATPADRLDVYLPAGTHADGSLPAVVLVLGVHPEPIDHPDIVRVASAISRLGVVVGVPESTALGETRITPEEPARLVDAALVLAAMREVDSGRIGLAGFSAGASLALIAAADPRLAEELRFVSNFGGYADAAVLLVDVATRTMELDGQVLPWPADARVRGDVLNIFLEALEPAEDRERLRAVLELVVAAAEPPRGPQPAIEARFSGDALVGYRLFTADDRASAEAALGGASERLRAQLRAISPLSFAGDIVATVFTMHGEGDSAIPISHAVLLTQALPPEAAGRFTRFGRFAHDQPGRGGLSLDDVPDIWHLTLHLHDIVATLTE